MRQIYFLLFFVFSSFFLSAQSSNDYWNSVTQGSFTEKGTRQIIPQTYQTFKLDIEAFKYSLQSIPKENNSADATSIIDLPMPDGSIHQFAVVEVPVMEAGLAVKFPTIKTYLGQGITNTRSWVRFDWTHKGFHALISDEKGKHFIDPYSSDDKEHYIAYSKKDFYTNKSFSCDLEQTIDHHNIDAELLHNISGHKEYIGNELRTYRIAISCTGEYSQFHGGTKASVLSELATVMNRVNGVYENEAAIRMILVANNDQIIYLNAASDPFNNNNANQIVNQNQSTIDNVIGSANYDIGHVVSTGGGGFAPGDVCQNGSKARAVTGLPAPVGDPFYIDYVCHEVGHQFSAGHTFNGSTGSCTFARWNTSAYEPGSGSTVMGYAGICSGQNIQNNSDDYFHTRTFDQVVNYSNFQQGNTCAVITQTGNSEPNVSAGTGGYIIPINTPFELTGTANDPDGDPLTFCWEQYDLGPQGAPNLPSGNAPIFRSFDPVPTPSRTFPQISDIVNNTQTMGEILPSYGRSLQFRLTARDNRVGGGGVSYDGMSMTVSAQAGPFLVTEPNTSGISWIEGTPATVNWDVANTNASPVNCQLVDITLSLDGGFTYPITLASGVPNNGTHSFLVPPGSATNQAKVRVQCATNVFFDISNQNFTITAPPAPTFLLWSLVDEQNICAPSDASFSLDVLSLLNYTDVVDITALDVPNGLTLSFSNTVTPGNTLNITATNTGNIPTGTYDITIQAVSTSGTQTQVISLTVYAEEPTLATLDLPVDGEQNAASSPELFWNVGGAPHTFQVQVATDPAFSNIIIDENGLTAPSFIAGGLNSLTVYYWRVKTDNSCSGESSWSKISTFRTSDVGCTTYGPGAPRVLLNGLAITYPSSLNISDDFNILDVNVIDLKGTHDNVGDLTFRLESPNGTKIDLLSRICNGLRDFDINFDNSAPNANYPCPPTNGGVYQPEEPLNIFNGESSAGTWILSVQDHEPSNGGQLAEWYLELCTSVESSNEDPIVVTNDELEIENGASKVITSELLLSTDADNSASELTYTLIEATSEGSLFLDGNALAIGSSFTQADIDNGLLSYTHSEGSAFSDHFRFDVKDGVGGWTGSPDFRISVIEDSNPFNLEVGEVWIYPNPASDILNISLRLSDTENVIFTIYDAIGQNVLNGVLTDGKKNTNNLTLDLAYLVNGVYIMVIEGETFQITEKIVVARK